MGRTRRRVIRAIVVGLAAGALLTAGKSLTAQNTGGSRFVGSSACAACHPEEYKSYLKYARKANSYAGVAKMRPKLTPEEYQGCLGCHSTGYGEPGGFRSEEETPELKNAGCEVCHGPGGRHVVTADAADIGGRLSRQVCERCHSQERVEAFQFKPLIYGGAH